MEYFNHTADNYWICNKAIMSSAEYFKEFVNERLTAAAEEIFRVFKQTVVEYEEEIDRQRRLLDNIWKPEIKLHRIELPQEHVCKEEEVLSDQQLCNQERNSSLDQEDSEPPQIKEEQEELCTSHDGEQLVLKQEETDTFMLTPTHEGSDHSEPEPSCDPQLVSNNSHVGERQDEKVDKLGDSEPIRNTEPKPKEKHNERSHSSNLSKPDLSEIHCNTHTGQTSLKCDTCGKDFKYKSKLQAHLSVHTDEKPYSCDACEKRFKNASVLNSHKRTHTGEKLYSCDTCGKRFTQKSYFKTHVKIHTGEEAHFCKTCGKRFITLSILKAHIRTHTGERPYLCKTCGERFKQASTLISHARIHTGEKPFTCKTCGRAFRQRWDLIVHMRIHTGERPYSCDTCGKRFSQISCMHIHIRTHTGEKPYSCDTCGKRFIQTSLLNRHRLIHTGEKPYSCKKCGRDFTRFTGLTRHMKTHTGEKL